MFPSFHNRENNKPYTSVGSKYFSDDKTVEIINDIPRFAASGSYASLFGDQWKEYKKTQLDSYTGSPTSESRLNRCLGDGLKDNLAAEVGEPV